MKIENCNLHDIDAMMALYEAARTLQTEKQMVVWPFFDRSFLEKEVEAQRQWKLVIHQTIVCNWTITYEDKEIWEERDLDDAIYIHRIATHPGYYGNRYIDVIIQWAKEHAALINKQYIRLDTLGNNTKLIQHYTSAGFAFLGMSKLTNTAALPLHYQNEPNCCRFEIDLIAHEAARFREVEQASSL
jgi:GNAT superfamily N-acetyltransferase